MLNVTLGAAHWHFGTLGLRLEALTVYCTVHCSHSSILKLKLQYLFDLIGEGNHLKLLNHKTY